MPKPPRRLKERSVTEATGSVALFDCLDLLGTAVDRLEPEPMETLGQSSGLIL